jgi:hypothetical protein
MITEETAVEYKTETAPLTLEIAKHYDRMPTLKGDRNPDSSRGKTRVGHLFELLRLGVFHSPVWSTVQITSEKGKKYRVDGGHSARMLVNAGAYFPENLHVTLRYFRAPTIDSAIDLYEQFNSAFSTRTTTDLIKNRAAYERQLKNIAPTYISRAIYGIGCHFKLRNPEEEFEVLDYIRLYPDFINWSSEFIKKRWLSVIGVIGAMYSTWIFSKPLSTEFWTMVHEETGLNLKCPTRTLSKFLQETSYDKNKMRQWPKRAIYVKCHHAWNAWRDGNSTLLKYIVGAPLPDPK